MRGKAKRKGFLIGFGSVALADILANGVAVILILILVTINLKKERDKIESRQIEEVSIVLSREIAKSAVANDLKSSRPALLHDYENSPIDQLLNPAFMPILELHDDYVRDYYSGMKVDRESLLLKGNLLERMAASFNDYQKERIRLDVYSVKLYYIALSILKEYGIDVKHWHFLGYPPSYEEKFDSADEILGDDRLAEPSIGDENDSAEGRGDEGTGEVSIPDGTSLSRRPEEPDVSGRQGAPEILRELLERFGREGTGNGRQIDEEEIARFLAENGDRVEELLDYLRNGDVREGIPGEFSSEPDAGSLAELLSMLAQRQPITFRVPGESDLDSEGPESLLPPPDMPLNVVLTVLMDFLQYLQTSHDNRELADVDLRQLGEWLAEVLENPGLYLDSDHAEVADLLAHHITSDDSKIFKGIPVRQEIVENVQGQALAIFPFKQMDEVVMQTDPLQESYEEKVYDLGNDVAVKVYRYPTLAESETVFFDEKGVILVPLDQQRTRDFRWRVIGIIKPDLRNFLIGYAYFAFDEELKIILPSSINDIRVNEEPVQIAFELSRVFGESLIAALYALLALLIVLVLFVGLRWKN